jgi:EpsG family
MLYLFIFFLLLAYACVRRSYFQFDVGVLFLIFLFLGGNYYNGYDWLGYTVFFDLIKGFNALPEEALSFEIGFMFFSQIVKLLFDEYQSLIWCVAAFDTLFLLAACRYSPSSQRLIYLIFCFYGWMYLSETLRQGMAICIAIYALNRFVAIRSAWHFYLFIIFAATFHVSVLFLIFVPAFERFSISDKKWIALTAVVAVLSFGALSNLGEILRFLLDHVVLPTFVEHRVWYYQAESKFLEGFVGIGVLPDIVLLLFLILSREWFSGSKQDSGWLWRLAILGVAILFVSRASSIAGRMSPYLLMMCIPYLMKSASLLQNVGNDASMKFNRRTAFLVTIGYGAAHMIKPLTYVHYRDSLLGYEWSLSWLFGVPTPPLSEIYARKCLILDIIDVAYCK